MEAAELAKLRQEYKDELIRYCKEYVRNGPYPTEEEFDYFMSMIHDSMIIYNAENNVKPIRIIEELVYYNIVCF